jgi:hypothetical protein
MYKTSHHIINEKQVGRMKPSKEVLQDIQNPIYWLSVHNWDLWQRTHVPSAEQQACQHFYLYQLVNGLQFQPKGVEADKIFLQEP